MSSAGLAKGTAGNISINDLRRDIWRSARRESDFETLPEDVVVMTLDGEIVDGNRKPSSEHETSFDHL